MALWKNYQYQFGNKREAFQFTSSMNNRWGYCNDYALHMHSLSYIIALQKQLTIERVG